MTSPLMSVIIPARNEADRLPGTIRSIAENRSTDFELEIVIVDDASTDGCCSNLVFESQNLAAPGLTIRVFRFPERVGVPGARNQGAHMAQGDVLFITDAHVRFSPAWDRHVFEQIQPNRILAATIADPTSAFKGYGCNLVIPFMGTRWNKSRPEANTPVQIPSCAGTILPKKLFEAIGGYDSGMILYSGAEPEFAVRAWLSGAEIISVPELEVLHRFKPKVERNQFLDGWRHFMVHNCLRFGMLYLSQPAVLQMLRYFALTYGDELPEACRLLEDSDVWERKAFLEQTLLHDFDWFIDRFDLKNQVGQAILREEQPAL